MSDLAAIGRGVGYLGVLGAVGGSAAAWLGRRTANREVVAFAWWARIGAVLLVLSGAALRLRAQVADFLEPGEPADAAAVRAVLSTRWGGNWKLQVWTAVAALALMLATGRLGARDRLGWLAAIALVATLPLTGHAVEFPPGQVLGVAAQGLHVLGAGLWLGTLAVLAAPVAQLARRADAAERRARLGALGAAFSPVALTGAALAVGGGVVLSIANVGSWAALTGTSYGRLVLVKLGLVAAAAALGAYNWRIAVPRLHAQGDAGPLSRSAAVELGIAAGLVVLTAVLAGSLAPGLE